MYPTDRHRDAAIAMEPRAAGLLNEACAILHWVPQPENVVDGNMNYGIAIQELLIAMFGSSEQEDVRDFNKVAFWQIEAVLADQHLDPCLAYHRDKCFRHAIYLEVCVPLVYELIIEKWHMFMPPMVGFCMLGELLMKSVYSFPFPPLYYEAPVTCEGGCGQKVFLQRRTHRRFVYHMTGCYSPPDDEYTSPDDSE
ncbi:hypothetical protein JTE90_020603 [Oedothorax gibbosus]|uniref:Uncharacterized protein n=1 Tax=Oedothorax gibbosus TaxID=931172 RepID=A0AAV6TTW4_9ARAC|nr:hypothetical protein JTE90_020603 [Oedothorax gibbosus]